MSVNIQPASAFLKTTDGRPILVDPQNPNCRATQRIPSFDLLKDLTELLAVDIEFQEFRHKDSVKWDHRIGRIAIVNTRGQTIYDTYVRNEYDADVNVKMPPATSGVTYKDISIANGAKPIVEAKEDLNKIKSGRTIIGHVMRLDIRALSPELNGDIIFVDTQDMYGQVKLDVLAAKHVGMTIQESVHYPTEDAQATILLYLPKYPYQKRSAFKPAQYTYAQDEFPSLSSTTASPKQHGLRGAWSRPQAPSKVASQGGCGDASDQVSANDEAAEPVKKVNRRKSKASKGERIAWWR